MANMKLQGSSGAFYADEKVNVRKIKENTPSELISKVIEDNNIDEIVVKDAKGQQFIAYADELSVKDGKMPKVGDKVSLDFVDGEATVTHVDDEYNEQWTSFLNGGIIGAMFGSEGKEGSDKAIQAISTPLAKEIKYSGQAVSQEDIQWALALESKVMTQGYQPSAADLNRYEKIATALQAESQKKTPAPAALPDVKPKNGASQTELDWALKLEAHVKSGYDPTPAERELYSSIFERLQLDKAQQTLGESLETIDKIQTHLGHAKEHLDSAVKKNH